MTKDFESFRIIHPEDYAAHGYPHPLWARLRREDPVHYWDRTEGLPFWAITKHADIVTIGKRPDLFLSGPRLVINHLPEQPNNVPPTLIQMDPPKHGIYRQLISKRFTPRYLKKIHGDIERIGKDIVDALVRDSDTGECDFVREVSAPLPIAVIAWLLGVPESDWKLLFDWTNRTIGAGDPEYQEVGKTPQETGMQAMTELFMYFTKLIEEKRKRPADDLVTLFASLEVDGKPIPPIDVITFCFIIVIAGNETTRNGTTGGMLALIEHQDELRKLQRNPRLIGPPSRRSCAGAARSSTSRAPPPRISSFAARRSSAGTRSRSSTPARTGTKRSFPMATVSGSTASPNHHLGFGVGEHFCLGSHLARLEMDVAYRHFVPRIEEIELAGPVVRLHSSLVGGVKQLPIRYKLKRAS